MKFGLFCICDFNSIRQLTIHEWRHVLQIFRVLHCEHFYSWCQTFLLYPQKLKQLLVIRSITYHNLGYMQFSDWADLWATYFVIRPRSPTFWDCFIEEKKRKHKKLSENRVLINLTLHSDIIALLCSLKHHCFPFAQFLFHFLFENTNGPVWRKWKYLSIVPPIVFLSLFILIKIHNRREPLPTPHPT